MWTAALSTGYLRVNSRSVMGDTTIFGTNVHKNNVWPDFAHAVPWNTEVIPLAPESQIFAWSGHDNGADVPFRHLDFHVLDETQSASVADADYFLTLKLGELYSHSLTPPA